jgi:hypothetical protein
MPQIVIPIIADVVDEKVARLLEYKPAVQCIPHGDETQDKVDAKVAKRFLRSVDQIESLDTKFRRAVKSAKIAGESFIFILWSKDKGETIVKAGETVTLHIFYFDYPYTEKLKREYPEKADQINSTNAPDFYDFETLQLKSLEGKTVTITFWHKASKYLPNGYEAIFCNNVILKKGDLPYLKDDGDLPCERFVDIENEQEVSGESFIDKVRGMASQYNNLTNLMIKHQMLSAPKK